MTITSDSPIYRKAFENYLRKGIAPNVFIKALHITPQYIWRTQHDNKVRPSHAANEGQVFSWNDPPPLTGNPGDEQGCRCWGDPYEPPLDPVYPELFIFPLSRTARIAAEIAARALNETNAKPKNPNPVDHTDHGATRTVERKISSEEIQKAVRTAEQTGEVITKIGKYGTPQKVYTGTNGVTVVKETAGRNAGKIITIWKNE